MCDSCVFPVTRVHVLLWCSPEWQGQCFARGKNCIAIGLVCKESLKSLTHKVSAVDLAVSAKRPEITRMLFFDLSARGITC